MWVGIVWLGQVAGWLWLYPVLSQSTSFMKVECRVTPAAELGKYYAMSSEEEDLSTWKKLMQPAFRAEDRIDEGGGLPQTMSKVDV